MEPESFDGLWKQSPDGTMLLLVYKGTVTVCDASRVLLDIGWYCSAHWLPDNTLATNNLDEIHVWHVRDARLLSAANVAPMTFSNVSTSAGRVENCGR